MTQEIDNTADNTDNADKEKKVDKTVNDVDNIFAVGGIALAGLALLFYPAEEVADATETDLGFVGTIAKVISGLGLIGTVWSAGLLYTREVDIHPLLKWVFVPLFILDVLLVTLLLAMLALDTASASKVIKLGLKYVKPVICTLGGAGLIIAMAVMPKKLLKMSMIGMAIHYLPAALGYAPINKHPFYALVIFVRAGGLITSLAADVIDVATANTKEQPLLDS